MGIKLFLEKAVYHFENTPIQIYRKISPKKNPENFQIKFLFFFHMCGVVGWCDGAVYLTSLGRPTDIGLQLGKACYPCSG